MYSNRFAPGVRVFPRNAEGKRECERMFGKMPEFVYFCPDYEQDEDTPNRCVLRDPRRMGQRNLCRHCPAGYLLEAALTGDLPGVDRRGAGVR